MASNTGKGKVKIPAVPGTKPSIKNAQLLVSTGIPSLDNIIGGGLTIGSILLIEEDTYGNYAKVMLKYFLAEGAVMSHSLLVASQDTKPDQLISEMPAVVTESPAPTPPAPADEKMQIAWRYQNMRILDSSPKSGQMFGHFYDLTKKIDKNILSNTDITLWDGEDITYETSGFRNSAYVDLLKTVQETLKKGEFYVNASPNKRNILRIGLHSLGSRLWLCDTEETMHHDFLKFLYCFRALLRSAFAVAVITMPSQCFQGHNDIVGRMEHLADTVVSLESFVGSSKETNPIFRDYHGLLHIKKLSAINTLAPHCPESFDLAFKLRRKKFIIEILHLPPELGDSTQREQDDSIHATTCGKGGSNLMDF
ncbi:elongator complex protein 4 [Diachasma alloeum]|uniref:elongator complex protein 4 n=1 Tax=Diachasma alloeum TaxID=454923 RepID=UPI0007382049|nr:elongator complex protein 4 [Diachasma alloeum]XP_015117261.1 elongator complex protein 4 [Diachasma alloeum]XP_015117262.1 elongator complex protein 4 [Diachasma alloeum]XP_015117263.1 elongator complex protein 4 [Diachasma alloeum]XP_015117264.1 elongator complex protein 4 [Diachasma alloeum]XP_028982150.1 elongator complex protein 4 [Diachasma alloeum]XP_028982151.1 elongator complex protein 4 [Diachasma alloeum]